LISDIHTNDVGNASFPCNGVAVGYPCQDIEDALTESFTVSFDFDDCGGGKGNFCQEALSKYKPSLGIISCTPSLVSSLSTGGDHCVSNPVIQSSIINEGDEGSLEWAINSLIDDNGANFMTVDSIPNKQSAVSVSISGIIKEKESCIHDVSNGPAVCSGSYEISYSVTFDAYHSSGDVPPLTIVNSDLKIDLGNALYATGICPSFQFSHGCVTPVGSALDHSHGRFL